MKKLILLITILFMMDYSFANSFNCNIENIQTSPSAQNFLVVTMSCASVNPIQSGTNGCTATLVSDNTFTFDTITTHGKLNLSILLSAWAANKRIYASTYGTCPPALPNTPILYGIKTFND